MIRQATWCLALLALFVPCTARAQPVLSSVDYTAAGNGLLTYDPVSGLFAPWTAYAQPVLSSVDLTVAGDGLLTYDPVSERFWLDQGQGEGKDGVTIGNAPPR